jgi:glycosyltransferase involved in cell wall biosynthesis
LERLSFSHSGFLASHPPAFHDALSKAFMRIAILHYTLPPVIGGVERVIRDQAAALEILGHEVELMTHTMERRRSVGIAKKTEPETLPPTTQGPFLNPQRFITRHRHDLPHWQQDNVICFITWRLADSLPREFIEKWMAQRKAWVDEHPRPWDEKTELAYHQRFDRPFLDHLDEGHGACVLQRKECSEAVEQALHHFDGLRYQLLSYVIMPNHVHLLVRLHPDWPMEKIVQNWKERSAKSINAILKTQGSVWQKGYFDHLIRGEEHLDYVQHYIRQNPEKARLRGGFSLWSTSLDEVVNSGNSDGMPTGRRRSMDLTGLDAILVHNVFTMPFDLAWTRELREMAAATPHIRWVNWVHDVAAINPHYAHLPWSQADYAQLSKPVPNVLNVTVSEARKQDYVRATGLREDQVQVIPNGLDLASLLGLTPRIAALRLWDHELVFVHPTRLIRRKNIELGLRVTAALRDAGCDVIYAVTGAPDPHQADGIAYHQELKALTEELDLADRVLFLGEESPLSDDDVRSLYTIADALFFPSTGEGFGLPLLEAVAHRLTVFCSDIPVHREVLGEAGQYFLTQSKPDQISARIMQWHPSAIVNHQRRHLWRRHEMVKICQEHLEPLLATANQST